VLLIYAQHGRTEDVEKLLEEGADIQVTDHGGSSALHIAAHVGALETVEMLLNRGALVNAQSMDGRTPLYRARISRTRRGRAAAAGQGC